MAKIEIPKFEQDPEKYYMSPDEYNGAILDLGTEIMTRGVDVDAVVGSARGSFGMMLDIAHILDVHGSRTMVHTVNLYNGDNTLNTNDDGVPVDVSGEKPVQRLTKELIDRANALFTDDLSHRGHTLERILKDISDLGASSVISCMLFHNVKDNKTGSEPDIFWAETDKWVVLPWERKGEYGLALKELVRLGASRDHIEKLRRNYNEAVLLPSNTALLG